MERMRDIGILSLVTLGTIGMAAPTDVGVSHLNHYNKRANGYTIFGGCQLERRAVPPSFPNQALILSLESATPPTGVNAATHRMARRIFWGNDAGSHTAANAHFPHWYRSVEWNGTPGAGLPALATVPSTNAIVTPNFGNVDHVFEISMFKSYLSFASGFENVLDDRARDDAQIATECMHFRTRVNIRPQYYPPRPPENRRNRRRPILDDDNSGFIQAVFKHIPGFEILNPEKYRAAAGEFAGLQVSLNSFKGRVMQGDMQSVYDDPDQTQWTKGVIAGNLTARMIEIERLTNVFEFMKEPEIVRIFKRSADRYTRVLLGIDDFLSRGNKATFDDPDTPFRKSDGTAYNYARGFRTWIQRYLERVQVNARGFIRDRINDLETDLSRATTTATNKAQVLNRLNALKASGRTGASFLTFRVDDMLPNAPTPATQAIPIFRIAAADPEPFAMTPFTNSNS